MLTPEQKTLIANHPAGMVATVNDDGTPSVSPKATFVILNDTTLAFGNIRSPGTLANIRKRPAVEVCFIDVVLRTAVRVTGSATLLARRDAPTEIREAFEAGWGPFHEHMTHYVQIDVMRSETILSPAYDRGATEDELRAANMEKLSALYASQAPDG
jgi:hypothetical protein